MTHSTKRPLRYHALLPILLTWLLLLLSFLLPVSNRSTPHYLDLSAPYMDIIYLVSESGKYGVPAIVLLVIALILSRQKMPLTQKIKETVTVLSITTILAGGGALLNEHIIKTQLQIPRPNIIWLAGEEGKGPLGMSAYAFYTQGDKEVRRTMLAQVLTQHAETTPLTPLIKKHWAHETGYSFPSGHSFSAMFFASFLLMLGASLISSKRYWLLYSLLPWALAVCISRPLLGVHTPMDVVIGGFQGLVLGMLAWLISIKLILR